MKTPTLRKPKTKTTTGLSPADLLAAGREESSGEDASTPEQVTWTGWSALVTKSITMGLWCCLVAGPLALLLALAAAGTSGAPAPTKATSGEGLVDERASVEAFAQSYVTTWLTTPRGQENRLAGYYPQAASITLPEQPWRAEGAATSGLRRVDAHTWSTTVAVTVSGPGGASPVRRYYQVPVRYDRGALVAEMVPAPVAGPSSAPAAEVDYQYRANPGEPVAQAAQDFLTAQLVGSSDVSRYISPGAPIGAVTPPPFVSVEVDDVLVDEDLSSAPAAPKDGQSVHLLVSATASSGEKQSITIQTALTMRARGGRWEVKALDAAPAVRPTSNASPTDGTSATSPPSGATTSPTSSMTN